MRTSFGMTKKKFLLVAAHGLPDGELLQVTSAKPAATRKRGRAAENDGASDATGDPPEPKAAAKEDATGAGPRKKTKTDDEAAADADAAVDAPPPKKAAPKKRGPKKSPAKVEGAQDFEEPAQKNGGEDDDADMAEGEAVRHVLATEL